MIDLNVNDLLSERTKHHKLTLTVSPRAAGYRGCAGLGMVVVSQESPGWIYYGNQVFISDAEIRWASLVDIPGGHWLVGGKRTRREVHLTRLHQTNYQYGMPRIAHNEEGQWDFHVMASGTPDAFPGREYPQLLKAFNAIEWAMTAVAFHFKQDWQPRIEQFHATTGLPKAKTPSLLFGQGVFTEWPQPSRWAPRAMLAFRENEAHLIFDRATRQVDKADPVYPHDLRRAFVRDSREGFQYVSKFAGHVLGITTIPEDGESPAITILEVQETDAPHRYEELRFTGLAHIDVRMGEHFPAGALLAWETSPRPKPQYAWRENWDWLVNNVFSPQMLDHCMRCWFQRQMVSLKPGFVHVDSYLAALAAADMSVAEELYWDVSPCEMYFHEDCDTFIFPPIRLDCWDELTGLLSRWDNPRGTISGAVEFDLTPTDDRFLSQERVAREEELDGGGRSNRQIKKLERRKARAEKQVHGISGTTTHDDPTNTPVAKAAEAEVFVGDSVVASE